MKNKLLPDDSGNLKAHTIAELTNQGVVMNKSDRRASKK